MGTKKLQIVTPIVTSVNGKTGDVTLDISGGGGTSVTKETITEALGYTPTKAWYVTFTTSNVDISVTADKTVAEIYQAYQDGYAVYGCVTNGTGILSLEAISSDIACFTLVDVGEDGMMGCMISWDANNSKWVLTQTVIASSSTEQSHLIVNVTVGDQISGTTQFPVTSVDKTVTEIYNAYTAGQIVIAKDNLGVCLQLVCCDSTEAYFSGTMKDSEISTIYLSYTDSEWTYYIETLETTLVNKVLAALPTWTGGSY